jgi:hypothetical protein
MSLTVDATGRRGVQVETVDPGTLEEVWRAIATGPGISVSPPSARCNAAASWYP